MSIIQSDIGFFYSGGSSNSDPTQSLGGAISSNQIVSGNASNLFDHIFQSSRDVGATDGITPGVKDYRVLYVKIGMSATGTGTLGALWLSQNTGISALSYRLGIGSKNTIVPKATNENTAPAGITFYPAPTTEGTGLSLPDVSPGDYVPIAIERSISVTMDTQTSEGPTLSTSWLTT